MSAPYEIISVWAVRAVHDDNRTGGIVGLALTTAFAEEIAKGKGSWGGLGSITEQSAIVADAGEVFLLERREPYPVNVDLPKERERKRQAALAKLTEEDMKLLGIKQ